MPFLSHESSEEDWQLITSWRVLFLDHLSYSFIYIYIKEITHTATRCSQSATIYCRQKGATVHFITSHILNTDDQKHRTRI